MGAKFSAVAHAFAGRVHHDVSNLGAIIGLSFLVSTPA